MTPSGRSPTSTWSLVTVDDKQLKPRDLCAQRRRRQRARRPVHAHHVARGRSKARGTARSCTPISPRAGCSTRTTRPSRTCGAAAGASASATRRSQLLRAATDAVPALYKAHKWMITRGDLDYTALWILYAAMGLARSRADRRAETDRSRSHAPGTRAQPGDSSRPSTLDLLNAPKTRANVTAALDAVDCLPGERAGRLFQPVLRLSARRRRGPIGNRDRRPLQAELRHRQRRDGVRIPRGSGPDRQGVVAGAPHPQEQRRGAGDWRSSISTTTGAVHGAVARGEPAPAEAADHHRASRALAFTTSRTSRSSSRATR